MVLGWKKKVHRESVQPSETARTTTNATIAAILVTTEAISVHHQVLDIAGRLFPEIKGSR